MGTWGEGIYHDDSAQNYVLTVIKPMESFITDYFAGNFNEKLGVSPDHYFEIEMGVYRVIPAIDLLVLIVRHCNTWLGISTDSVTDWKSKFLIEFDIAYPKEAEKRLQILGVFESLENLIQERETK